jgi:hypothetical protein
MRKISYSAIRLFFLLSSLTCFAAFADEETGGDVKYPQIRTTGYASYQFGQIIKGQYLGSDAIDHWWSHQVFAGIGFAAKLNERFDLVARIEGEMWSTYPFNKTRDFRRKSYSLWLDQAQGTYSFGDLQNPVLQITGGYFVYKYNPEVRDLGEFLFRTYTYPGVMINFFDFPAARLLGFRFHNSLFNGNFTNDMIAFEESDVWPFGDISLAYIGKLNMGKVLEIGAGIDFAHLFSVRNQWTTPEDSVRNRIIDHVEKDSSGMITDVVYGDGFYTFKAIKLMGRATFDPKPIFGNPSALGEQDLKLYAEAGIIGLKNYSYYYNDITKRMPVMFGFYLPTFKLLDCLAVEFEHYAYPFSTSYEAIETGAVPMNKDLAAWNPRDYKYDDWKWSVYAKRTLLPGVAMTLELARDHFRTNYVDGMPIYSESLARPGQWMWIAKFSGSL